MTLKLLKLNAKDEISSGAMETSSSGSLMERKISPRAGTVHPCGLVDVLGQRLQGAGADQEHVREAEPEVHHQHADLGQPGIGQPGDLLPRRARCWLMKPNSGLSMPDQTRPERKAGKAYGRIIRTR